MDAAIYDGEIPRNYDRYLGPILFTPYAEDLAARLPGNVGDVLELACGTGILTQRLLDRLPGAHLVATDLSPAMLEYARSRVVSEKLEWRQADATALPFPEAVFDAVVCQFGIMFFPDKPAAMREVRRVLRPGGTFLFNVWGGLEGNDFPRIAHQALRERFPEDPPGFLPVPHSYHEPEVIRSVLEGAGFSDVTLSTIETAVAWTSARDYAAGAVLGLPLRTWLETRTDPSEMIDLLTEKIGGAAGDSIRGSRLSAIVVTARRSGTPD